MAGRHTSGRTHRSSRRCVGIAPSAVVAAARRHPATAEQDPAVALFTFIAPAALARSGRPSWRVALTTMGGRATVGCACVGVGSASEALASPWRERLLFVVSELHEIALKIVPGPSRFSSEYSTVSQSLSESHGR